MKTAIQEVFGAVDLLTLQSSTNNNFKEIKKVEEFILLIKTANEDASGGAVTYYLPDGNKVAVCYLVRKIDASANAVTVAAYGTDTIEGAATYALPNQYDKVLLQYEAGVWYRVSQ